MNYIKQFLFPTGGREIVSGVCVDDPITGEEVCGCDFGYQRLYDICVPVIHSKVTTIFSKR